MPSPKLSRATVALLATAFAALPPVFAVSTLDAINDYNGNTSTTGLTNSTSPTNWSLGIPFFTTGAGSYAHLRFNAGASGLFQGAGTNPAMNAASFNVTNGNSYTLQINGTATTGTASSFRVGATSNTGTTEVILDFTNPISGIQQNLIYLSNGSDLTFNAATTTTDGLLTTFQVRQAGNYNLSSGSVLTFNTAISGNHAITINGAGRVVYNAANSSTALTTINGGTLELGIANAISNSAPVTVAGGTLDIKTFNDTVAAVTISSGSITGTTGVLTGSSYTATNSGTISAILAGTGELTKSGAGTLVLTAANTYTGTTRVNEGTLQIGNGGTTGTIGSNSNAVIASGATLLIERSTDSFGYAYSGALSGEGTVNIPSSRRFNFQTNNQTQSGNLAFTLNGVLGINTLSGVTTVQLGELAGSGIIQRAGNAGGSATVVIGGKNTNSTYSGTISSVAEFSLEKVGTGTLTLSGSTYGQGGGTTITAGTLLLNGEFTSTANAVTVGAAGTLGGTGIIDGPTTVNGRLAPGSNAIGTLRTAALTFSPGSTFVWEMNFAGTTRGVNYDAVTFLTGTLGGSGAAFNIVLPGNESFSSSFWQTSRTWSDIFQAQTIQGVFSGFAYSNAAGTISGPDPLTQGSFTLDGTSLVWSAIPEPSAFTALAGLGALGAAGLRRRRRA